MKLIFYKTKHGVLNNFLERQIELADLQGVEVESKILDSASAKEVSDIKSILNDRYPWDYLLETPDHLTHYNYIFSDSEGQVLSAYFKPLDYFDLRSIVRFLKEDSQ